MKNIAGQVIIVTSMFQLKGTVYKSYVRPAILHGSEAWYLKDSEMGIL